MVPRLAELVDAADLNGLLRAVDALCEARGWEELVELADACEDAIERGKQLWPIAAHIDYRLALEAPGDYAAAAIESGGRRFALGPLTEVAASTHTWDELAPHMGAPQDAAYVAHERVLRGEILLGDTGAHPEVLEIPLALEPWEPTYAVASYRRDHVEVSEPWEPATPMTEQPVVDSVHELDEPDVVAGLLDLVQPWLAESNGAARAVVVEGDGRAAASALTLGSLRIGPLKAEEALQRMAWAAASGGAHGRRRGAALGRWLAWYTTALLVDVAWPVAPARLGKELERLRWYRWDEGSPEEGWVLRIAADAPDEGWAAAVAATDVLEEAGGDEPV
jgi:hypothetical protein